MSKSQLVYFDLDIIEVESKSEFRSVVLSKGPHYGKDLVAAQFTSKSDIETCLSKIDILLNNKDHIRSYVKRNYKGWQPFRSGYLNLLDGSELDLMDGVCEFVGIINITRALRQDLILKWSKSTVKYGDEKFSYPIGGEAEYDKESELGTIWLNQTRWDYVQFLKDNLPTYLEKL